MSTLNAEVIDAMMWRAGQTRNWAWDSKWPANVQEFFDGDVPAIFAELARLRAEHEQALEALDEIRQGTWALMHVDHAQDAVRRARRILRGQAVEGADR